MGILDLGRYKGIVFAITGFLVFIAIILAMNHAMVGRFADDTAGIKFLSQAQTQPKAIHDSAVLVAQQLEQGDKIEDTIETIRKNAAAFDQAIISVGDGMVLNSQGETLQLSALTTPESAALAANAKKIWEIYKSKMDPLLRFSGSPYAAEAPAAAPVAPAGKNAPVAQPSLEKDVVQLSPRGRKLHAAIVELNDYSAASHAQLSKIAADLTSQIEADSTRHAGLIRGIQVGGLVAALLLLGAIFFYFARNLRKEEAVSARARKETADILRTVNEGLFLLDKDLKLKAKPIGIS